MPPSDDDPTGLLSYITEIRDKVAAINVPTLPELKTAMIGAVSDGIQEGVKTMASDILGTLKNFMIEVLSHAPQPPKLTPTDPAAALDQLAKAIKSTESTLNAENLVIANGTVDLEIYLPGNGTDAGGRARLSFTIGPRQ